MGEVTEGEARGRGGGPAAEEKHRAEAVARQEAAKRQAAEEKRRADRQRQEACHRRIREMLAKIPAEKTKGYDVAVDLFLIGLFVFLSIVCLINGQPFWCVIFAVFVIFYISDLAKGASFDGWIKKNKLEIPDFDQLIKSSNEFARGLYFEKCRKKAMLKYIEKQNPNMLKTIQSDKRFRENAG